MAIGTALFLIVVGAILAWVVSGTLLGISLSTIGLIMVIIGLFALAYTLLWTGAGTRTTPRGTPRTPA